MPIELPNHFEEVVRRAAEARRKASEASYLLKPVNASLRPRDVAGKPIPGVTNGATTQPRR